MPQIGPLSLPYAGDVARIARSLREFTELLQGRQRGEAVSDRARQLREARPQPPQAPQPGQVPARNGSATNAPGQPGIDIRA